MSRELDYWGAVTRIIDTPFDTRHANVVPTTDTVKLKDGGVYVDAVYLYCDMADSTGMAARFTEEAAARIVRSFLSVVVRILKHHEGEVRSYDGDRVMAIFMGADAPDRAARAALEIKWTVDEVVHPALFDRLEEYDEGWTLKNRTGIDVGEAFIVRAGVRDNNDLVSIGEAPNIAAKLSDLKIGRTMITDQLWDQLSYSVCFSRTKDRAMWSEPADQDVGGQTISVRHSNWGWVVP